MKYEQANIPLLLLAIQLLVTGTICADEFTFSLKAWNPTLSADNLDGGTELYPGANFSWQLNDHIWISSSYLEGNSPFDLVGTNIRGELGEVDFDFVMGWSTAWLDIGVGYRFTSFTTKVGGSSVKTESEGPMVYLGGSNTFGESKWGYYWGAAHMFEDLSSDDGSQTHFNVEAGGFWASGNDYAILLGYRLKEYGGDGSGDLSLKGIVVNLAFNF